MEEGLGETYFCKKWFLPRTVTILQVADSSRQGGILRTPLQGNSMRFLLIAIIVLPVLFFLWGHFSKKRKYVEPEEIYLTSEVWVERVRPLLRDAIRIRLRLVKLTNKEKRSGQGAEIPHGGSKFGGAPDIPDGFD